MKAVNLLPANRRSVKRASEGLDPGRRNLLIACGGVGALIVVGLSVMVWSSSSSIGDKKKQLQALQSQIASTATDASLATNMGTRKTTVTALVATRLSWDQFLGTLSKVMPEDVWLESLQSTTAGAAANLATAQAAAATAAAARSTTTTTAGSTAPRTAAPAAVASTFTMTGYTYSQPSVARMMRRLDDVPWLSGVSLVSSSKTAIGPSSVFQFTVKAAVISPQGTP
jgi:Tfp pilus assembly protein PilN